MDFLVLFYIFPNFQITGDDTTINTVSAIGPCRIYTKRKKSLKSDRGLPSSSSNPSYLHLTISPSARLFFAHALPEQPWLCIFTMQCMHTIGGSPAMIAGRPCNNLWLRGLRNISILHSILRGSHLSALVLSHDFTDRRLGQEHSHHHVGPYSGVVGMDQGPQSSLVLQEEAPP